MLRLRPTGSREKNPTKAAATTTTTTTATTNRRQQQKNRKYRNLNRHRRKNSSTSQRHHLFIVCGLVIVTIVEVIYLFYNGREGEQEGFVSNPVFSNLRRANERILDIIISGRVFNNIITNDHPIDDYNSRPHIKYPPVPLIVGGSDGSGTRAFASILEQLDVPMIVDDRGTMDVHAKIMFDGGGWPPLVTQLLNVTHSPTYEVENLPVSIQKMATEQLGSLITELENRGLNIHDKAVEAGRQMSSSVSWGFKAPVSMLLIPFFRQHFSAIKIIHIVRDGRDIALSDNHSPVEKFYDPYFNHHDVTTSWKHHDPSDDDIFTYNTIQIIKAMQLWNDWNEKVYNYIKSQADDTSLDVLVMRTEDLIQQPFESIMRLAHFVGSPKTPKDICCLSQRGMDDLGKSSTGGLGGGLRGGRERIASLFGPDELVGMNRRFEDFFPGKEASSLQNSLGKKDHILTFEEIRNKMIELENGATEHRRLLEEEEEENGKNDDEIEIELPKELPRSAIDINKLSQYAADNFDAGGGGEGGSGVGFDRMRRQMEIALHGHDDGVDSGRARSQTTVKERYGKWVRILKSTPKLSERLHFEGKESLALFGYEPTRVFMDVPTENSTFKCDETVICEG